MVLEGDDWAAYSSKTKSEIPTGLTQIHENGIVIQEIHEIDRIVGNVIHIKSATMTPLNSKYEVSWVGMQENIGFEDIHFDTNFDKEFEHSGDHENGKRKKKQ